MDFAFSPEQDALRDTVRAYLERHAPTSAARAAMATPGAYDLDVWRRFGDELGLHGIHIPVERGGQGFGHLELAVVCEEIGRNLLVSPYQASTVWAATLIASCESTDPALDEVAQGVRVGTVAWAEAQAAWSVDGASTVAVLDGDRARVTGEKVAVPYGIVADTVVVLARSELGEPVVVAIDAAAEGMIGQWLDPLDLTSHVARLRFSETPARVLATGTGACRANARTRDVASVMLAASMVGGARACVESAVAYSLQRRQFGRPIGSFQAIKHLCVDMLVELELATAATHFAAWALDSGEHPTRAAAMAKAMASDAYLFVADAALHVHGGIGFTWEHDSHLHLRRARSASIVLGSSRSSREDFLRAAGFDDGASKIDD